MLAVLPMPLEAPVTITDFNDWNLLKWVEKL
jgi:hypothetical protein